MKSPTGDPLPLPGLGEQLEQGAGAVELAAARTLSALDDDDLLTERDALLCQSLLTLARQYDRAATSSRAKDYAIANLHAQLLATLEALPKPVEGEGDEDEWTAAARAIALEQQRLTAARDEA